MEPCPGESRHHAAHRPGQRRGWRDSPARAASLNLTPPPSSAPEEQASDPDVAAAESFSRLDRVPVGRRVEIVSLPSDPVLQERLRALGIRPGAAVEVVRRGRPGGILHLAHGPLEFMLRRAHAAEIQVR